MTRPALTVRLLAVSVGLVTSAGTLAAPGHADTTGNSFLAALNNAGVAYDDPASTVSLGQSICPMLVQPGGSLASVASSVSGTNGMSPDAAGLFTSVAMAMFCPAMISSQATGNSPIPLRIPGL
jgi:hypothetical protein